MVSASAGSLACLFIGVPVMKLPKRIVLAVAALSSSCQYLMPAALANQVSNATPSSSTANSPTVVHAGTSLVTHSNPVGSKEIIDFSASSILNIAGDFKNAGIIYLVSNNPSNHNAVITAQNIVNLPGGLITSILPANGLPGYTNAISNLSITVAAVNQIVNNGTISSAANLSAVAGSSINNSLPVGITGAAPVMQAFNNLNILSPNIVNQ